jgi:glycosyltransferase involved in cell wall biosynthesis
MDGGSSDNSVDIIKSHASKIAYWQSQPDGGQAAAINAGMRRATGELVAWLNSDDYYLKDAFKHMLRVYRKNPDASFYAGNGHRVTETGMIKEPFYKDKDVVFDRHSLICSVDYILQPTTFMSRKYLEAVNYLDPNLHYGMDWDLFIRLSAQAEPVIFFDFIAATREYADTKTASGYFKRIEELRLIAKKHSGYDLTPGVICYAIGDLLNLCEKHPNVYSGSFILEMHSLWNANRDVLVKNKMDVSNFFIKRKKPRVIFVYADKIYKNIKDFIVNFLEYIRSVVLKAFESIKKLLLTITKNLFSAFQFVYQQISCILNAILKQKIHIIKSVYRSTRAVLIKACVSIRILRSAARFFRTLYYRMIYGVYAK